MPPRQRLVRRRPLSERISGWLNPSDFLLWASEEIKTRDLDAASVGTKIAVGANVVFLIARANYGATITGDDVFSEPRFNWATLFAKQVVWVLALGSIINALSLTYQKRHYRLFEANLEQKPGTPSAHRVRVQSSPMSSSPMRLLAGALGSDSAESRAHPDKTRDVWEIAVWDPIPACLQGIIYFSPVHVLVYMFALPLDPMENRPSVTVFKSLVMQVILSLMLQILQGMNDQRQKDAALVQREVMREYDTKYVHPRLHPLVRDVGVQAAAEEGDEDLVETGVATTLIRRGFQTHPNPNYMKHIDPDSVTKSKASAVSLNSRLVTPASRNRYSDTFGLAHQQSARQPRQSMPALGSTPVSCTSTSTATNQQAVSTGTNFGGSLGVFTHSNSPLKKATSLNDINNSAGYASPRNSREMAAMEQREATDRMQPRETPLKLTETADAPEQQHTGFTPVRGSNPFAKDRARRFNMERYPSRW